MKFVFVFIAYVTPISMVSLNIVYNLYIMMLGSKAPGFVA